jgi:hypothetical protein
MPAALGDDISGLGTRTPSTRAIASPCRALGEPMEHAMHLAVVEDLLTRTAQPSGWAVLSTAIFYR